MNKVKMTLKGIGSSAFAIIGAFSKNARQQGWTKKEIKAVIDECKPGDYDHLNQTIMSNINED